SGNSASRPGTWPPACCSSRRRAGWWEISRATPASWNRAMSAPRLRRFFRRCSRPFRSGLERVVAHHVAYLDAVVGEPAAAPLCLGREVLGVIAPCGKRLRGLELDDGDVFAVSRLVLAVGNEARHGARELVHAGTDGLDFRFDSRLGPAAK